MMAPKTGKAKAKPAAKRATQAASAARTAPTKGPAADMNVQFNNRLIRSFKKVKGSSSKNTHVCTFETRLFEVTGS